MPTLQFVRKRRLQKSGILLHHTSKSMDEIARLSGFCDRFHLARIFKEATSYSHAQYRKKFHSKTTITPEGTLVNFDENQSAERGITSLKYFCENAP